MSPHILGVVNDGVLDSIVVDDGSIFITGNTSGDWEGFENLGAEDGFIAKISKNLELEWGLMYQTDGIDRLTSLANIDEGSIVAAGWTQRDATKAPHYGNAYSTVMSLDPRDGEKQWEIELKDYASIHITSLTGYEDRLYAIGFARLEQESDEDVYIAEINRFDGSVNWQKTLEKPGEQKVWVAEVDSEGDIILGGWSFGGIDGETGFGSRDSFITKLGRDGSTKGTRLQGGYELDTLTDLTILSDNSVIGVGFARYGDMFGISNSGIEDAFIASYSPEGHLQWADFFGTNHWDRAHAVTTDKRGEIVVVGKTHSSLEQGLHVGGADIFIRNYDPNGSHLKTTQIGSSGNDFVQSIEALEPGVNLLAGSTSGRLDSGGSLDGTEAFVATVYDDSYENLVPLQTEYRNANTYHLLPADGLKWWEESVQDAKLLGGNLVEINDDAENQWILNTFKEKALEYAQEQMLPESGVSFFWLGLSDAENEGEWRWFSGEEANYFNWDSGEPSIARSRIMAAWQSILAPAANGMILY